MIWARFMTPSGPICVLKVGVNVIIYLELQKSDMFDIHASKSGSFCRKSHNSQRGRAGGGASPTGCGVKSRVQSASVWSCGLDKSSSVSIWRIIML